MTTLIVVENTNRWSFELPGVEVVSAKQYLVDPRFAELRGAAVFNLCRTYGYQGLGYYVSLLAAARGHRPLPSVATIQSLRISPVIRIIGEELDDLIQQSLRPLKTDAFELSVYFGRNVAKRYDRLSQALFNQFPAPFLRASFTRQDDAWSLESLAIIAAGDIPESHRAFVIDRAAEYFSRRRYPGKTRRAYRYDLAILWRPDDDDAPSDQRAIQKFIRAARAVDIQAETITADDYGHIAEYDALFLRETTYVHNHTFRFARRAAAEGLIVVDDPESIIRCTNKVYQAEVFSRHNIPSPRTMIVHEGNTAEVADAVGFPCVLKAPDSSYSQGVVRVESATELDAELRGFFKKSDLMVVQEYLPTDFDWRIGVLDGVPLYCSKYHMARGHWQIIQTDARGTRYGKVEALPLDQAPKAGVDIAVRAARLVGRGLYGIDIKQVGKRFLVVEINDNPSLEAGYEDSILGDELYAHIMRWFRQRLDERGSTRGPS